MPARHHVLKLATAVAAVQTATVLLATRAFAAPTPSPSPSNNACDLLRGEAREICEGDTGSGGGGGGGGTSRLDPTSTLDPLSSLAKGCAEAASWTVDKLSVAVKETANVDFTNPKFLQQYAVVFAASTVLTLLLWLMAVAKRAVRGVPSAPPSAKPSASSG